jgi:hypothetical protein
MWAVEGTGRDPWSLVRAPLARAPLVRTPHWSAPRIGPRPSPRGPLAARPSSARPGRTSFLAAGKRLANGLHVPDLSEQGAWDVWSGPARPGPGRFLSASRTA